MGYSMYVVWLWCVCMWFVVWIAVCLWVVVYVGGLQGCVWVVVCLWYDMWVWVCVVWCMGWGVWCAVSLFVILLCVWCHASVCVGSCEGCSMCMVWCFSVCGVCVGCGMYGV